MLNPPTGRPTNFITRMRTNEDALFAIFAEFANGSDDYPYFDKYSGVSTEMIKYLCQTSNEICMHTTKTINYFTRSQAFTLRTTVQLYSTNYTGIFILLMSHQ